MTEWVAILAHFSTDEREAGNARAAGGATTRGRRVATSVGGVMARNAQLDLAIAAYRADPTPENHARLLAAQRAEATSFMRRQSNEFIERTIERK